jgi:hypothetical protein
MVCVYNKEYSFRRRLPLKGLDPDRRAEKFVERGFASFAANHSELIFVVTW